MGDYPLYKRASWYVSEGTVIILGLSILQFGFLSGFTLTGGEEEFLALIGIPSGLVSMAGTVSHKLGDD